MYSKNIVKYFLTIFVIFLYTCIKKEKERPQKRKEKKNGKVESNKSDTRQGYIIFINTFNSNTNREGLKCASLKVGFGQRTD